MAIHHRHQGEMCGCDSGGLEDPRRLLAADAESSAAVTLGWDVSGEIAAIGGKLAAETLLKGLQ